ncbi:MAG: ABC transporter ATP-binding protein [Tissierellia bacterium]|nr:ABC transporter ATP-binding protein [Tissierellia bacterium]
MINLNNVQKIFNKGKANEIEILKDIDFSISKGEFISIMGTSDTGKSTLLNIIGCIENYTSGSYKLNGKEVKNLNDKELSNLRNEYFGFIFQEFMLIENENVYDNIMNPLLFNSNVRYKEIRERVLNIMDLVGLERNLEKKKTSLLSGGQKQRVAIARALVNNPKVILADEPTGSLDVGMTGSILELLKSINQQGVSIIMVTHDPQVAKFSDNIYMIESGKIHLIN